MKAPRETDLVAQCLAWLRLHGVFAWRCNSGAAVFGSGKSKRFVRFHDEPGMPDIVGVLPGGRMLVVEAKMPGARTALKRRLEQESFRERVTALGGLALLVTSLAELEKALVEELR
jgi:hypothetical protein